MRPVRRAWETDVKRIAGRGKSTQKGLETKKEGKTRSGQAKELHLTGKRNGEGGRGARSSERR